MDIRVYYNRSISRAELARRIKKSYDYLYKIEQGQTAPSLQTLCDLTDNLGVIKIIRDHKEYLLIDVSFDSNNIKNVLTILKAQKEAEDVASISKDTIVKAFMSSDSEARSKILQECKEAFEAIGEALCT